MSCFVLFYLINILVFIVLDFYTTQLPNFQLQFQRSVNPTQKL